MKLSIEKNDYIRQRKVIVPLSSVESMAGMSPNPIKERPLKQNVQTLSFKGLSISKTFENKASTVVEEYGKEFGSAAKASFEEKIKSIAAKSNSGLILDHAKDQVTFIEPTFLKRALDILVYPVTGLPLDLTNGTLGLFKKIPGLKKSSMLDNIMNTPMLKGRQDAVKTKSHVAGIQRYFDMVSKGKSGFFAAHARLKPEISNYNSETERTLTRVVTGLIPAFFLANDAYNLSVSINKDKNIAKEEKKRRFRQEIIRIGLTAGTTFATLRLFSKAANQSMMASTLITSATVVASEILGRIFVGNPVLPISKKDAHVYAVKQGKIQENSNNDSVSNETSYKGNKSDESNKKKSESLLTVSNFLKVVGGLLALGLSTDGLAKTKFLEPKLKKLADSYGGLYKEEAIISRGKFNYLMQKLRNNGFETMASHYEKIAAKQKGDNINLGKEPHKVKEMIIHNIIGFPVRFVWNTLMLPYKKMAKPIYVAIKDHFNTAAAEARNAEDKLKATKKKESEYFRKSIQFLEKIDNNNKEEYKKIVNGNLLSSLDNVTKSNYSNSELGSMFKIVHSTITSLFLVLDNYNIVMIDSDGKNKDLAEEKAKERILQRTAKIIYSAFLIKLFNGVFAGLYNSSLLGAQLVNTAQVMTNETLERKSVGLPLGESTPEEIKEAEIKNLEATGFKGAYFRFMAQLTGKKPMIQAQDN